MLDTNMGQTTTAKNTAIHLLNEGCKIDITPPTLSCEGKIVSIQ